MDAEAPCLLTATVDERILRPVPSSPPGVDADYSQGADRNRPGINEKNGGHDDRHPPCDEPFCDLGRGFFMVLEDQARVGDVAIINGTGGLVEAMTVRTITRRDLSGVAHVFPNRTISTLSK